MKSVHGHKDYVIVLIHKLDHFVHPSLVILHPHQTSEYTHSVIYMYDIIPYCK